MPRIKVLPDDISAVHPETIGRLPYPEEFGLRLAGHAAGNIDEPAKLPAEMGQVQWQPNSCREVSQSPWSQSVHLSVCCNRRSPPTR
jgi:hypothetical protein